MCNIDLGSLQYNMLHNTIINVHDSWYWQHPKVLLWAGQTIIYMSLDQECGELYALEHACACPFWQQLANYALVWVWRGCAKFSVYTVVDSSWLIYSCWMDKLFICYMYVSDVFCALTFVSFAEFSECNARGVLHTCMVQAVFVLANYEWQMLCRLWPGSDANG